METERAVKYVFTDPNNHVACILARPLPSDDPDFICFLSGSGRRYQVRKSLILSIESTNQEFQLRQKPVSWQKEVKQNE